MRTYSEPKEHIILHRRGPLPGLGESFALLDSTLDSSVALLLTGSLPKHDPAAFDLLLNGGATPFFFFGKQVMYPAETLSLPAELSFTPASLQPEGIFVERFMHTLFNRGELSSVRYATLDPEDEHSIIFGVAGSSYRIESPMVETVFDELIHQVRSRISALQSALVRWREVLSGGPTLAALANSRGGIIALSPSLSRHAMWDKTSTHPPNVSDILQVASLGSATARVSMAPVPAESPLYTLMTWESADHEQERRGEPELARKFLFHALEKKIAAILTAATYRPFDLPASHREDSAMLQLIQAQAEEMRSLVSIAEQALMSESMNDSGTPLGSLLDICAAERRALDQLVTVNFAEDAIRSVRIPAARASVRALFLALFSSVSGRRGERSLVDVTVRAVQSVIEIRFGLLADDDTSIDTDWLSVARTIGGRFGANVESRAGDAHTSPEIIVTLP